MDDKRITFKDVWLVFKNYCFKGGAKIKISGDYGYKSKKYNQRTNTGRCIQLKSGSENGLVTIWDNKKGVVKINIREEKVK
uniref:Uncharacterized protein n=1 Tax=viral metagenome TaxID=1070528 RepID=A0A6M3LJ17_9ZZZZ